jgi:2-keto-3-deoxy-L-rhamnonate aldolase RhmA
MRPNRLRQLLDDGQPTLGTRLLSSWPTMLELVGHSRMFDYVEFVAEYAPYDLYALENLGRAVDLFDHMSAMIKIQQESRLHLATRAIGAGIQNVLFTDPRNAEDAQECVRVTRFERPKSGGIQGVALHRSVGIFLDAASPESADALDETVVAIMIEKESAVANLESILAVPGIDMVQFGPADYAMSLGLEGQLDAPQIKEAELHTIRTALKMGISPRVELNQPSGFEPYLDMGVRHFNLGIDARILFNWYSESGAIMRKELGLDPAAESAAPQGGNYGK